MVIIFLGGQRNTIRKGTTTESDEHLISSCYESGKWMHIFLLEPFICVKLARDVTRPICPQKVAEVEGKWDPENFREIQVGEMLFHLARFIN